MAVLAGAAAGCLGIGGGLVLGALQARDVFASDSCLQYALPIFSHIQDLLNNKQKR